MDPISLTASVITVATTAFASGKSLHGLIQTYIHAEEITKELSAEIEGLNGVLCSLQTIGGKDKGASFSQAQCRCLKKVEPALENCSAAYKAFKAKVDGLLRSSTEDHPRKRKKILLHFKINEIAPFRLQLNSYKLTLTIALLVTSIESSSSIHRDLSNQIDSALGRLTGQMEGVKLAVQAIEDTSASNQSIIENMKQTVQAISLCGEVCKSATNTTGTSTYKIVQAFDQARFMMGNTNTVAIAGGSTRVFDEVVGRNQAKVWIGDTNARTALDFMKD